MSKQSTLFRAWSGATSSATTSVPTTSHGSRTTGTEEAINVDELGFDNFDDFDDFFEDEELAQACDNAVASEITDPPSHSVLNTSLNSSLIEDIPGFDTTAGQIWIYPTNYPVRDYQFNIVQKSLFKNTLVCLPTGLGKTFIAAVAMFNFYRWYPSSKIVFLAPTKPLVAQQIEACYNVMGIPQDHAAEMTGQLPPRERIQLWKSKRVFFLTPQVMQNDLARGVCPAQDVCCVVFDEAHKALGNHAYCQVIRELTSAGSQFRVLALSATPGNDLKAVQQVVTNLQVSQIELRSEDSFDIQQYVHQRKVEKIVVPLEGEILHVKTTFLKVLSEVVNRLVRHGLLFHSNVDRLSKFAILQARDQFRMNGPPPGVQEGAIEGDFALAISLFHAYELLQLHGMRSFYQFLSQTFTGACSRAKLEVMRSPAFGGIMRTLREKVGHGSETDSPRPLQSPEHVRSPRDSPFNPRASPTGPFFYSHPKLNKLEEVVLNHFRSSREQSTSSSQQVNTRVMIFSQYRESVQEIAEMLSQHTPLVRVMNFVGHSSAGKSTSKGLSQKEQTEVVRKFRQGGYNTLVSTCVGEEGLDIGEVDLIVCFDAHKSPIRLVQRMGRTGRKRSGRIVVIVAEGKEEQVYLKSQSNKNSIHRAIREGCKSLHFYQGSLRMVPRHIVPQVQKMHMSISEFVTSFKRGRAPKGKTGQSRLSFGPTRKDPKGVYLTDSELAYWSGHFALADQDSRAVERAVDKCLAQPTSFLSIGKLKAKRSGEPVQASQNTSLIASANTTLNTSTSQGRFSLSLEKWVHWQTAPLPHRVVGHSLKSKQLTSTLEFIDRVQTGSSMGQSYDLEMRTFLNPEDVKMPSEDRERARRSETPREFSAEQEVGIVSKKRPRKKQIIFDDSSDDEDFRLASSKPASKKKKSESATPSTQGLISPQGSTAQDVEGEQVVQEAFERPPEHLPEDDESRSLPYVAVAPALPTAVSVLTASQHAVPKAPSADSLDWLDTIDPSQISTPRDGCKFTSRPPLGGLSSIKPSRSHEELRHFEFVIPRTPPSLKRARPTHSTPVLSLSHSVSPKPSESIDLFGDAHSTPALQPPSQASPKPVDSIDLFSDLSSTALFEDFSDNLQCSSKKIPHERPSISYCHQEQDELQDAEAVELHTDIEFDANVTVIEESDLEDEESDNEKHKILEDPEMLQCLTEIPDTSEDSFIQVHGRGKPKSRKTARGLLQSPSTPSTSTATIEVSSSVSPISRCKSSGPIDGDTSKLNLKSRTTRNSKGKLPVRFDFASDSSDDEFDAPLQQRLKKKFPSIRMTNLSMSPQPIAMQRAKKRKSDNCAYVEEEAELSDAHPHCGMSSDETEHDSNAYDVEDSFINDASVLTQFSPTQRCRTTSKGMKSPANIGDIYRRSLMSPDNLFASKRRGCGNRYRMVFSQRHQLLNHYIKKAGFKVAASAKPKKGKSHNIGEDAHLFSNSEAEEVEVRYGEEDMEELQDSESQECDEELQDSEQNCPHKQRAAILSDLEVDADFVDQLQSDGSPVKGSGLGRKTLRLSSSPTALPTWNPVQIPSESSSNSSKGVCLAAELRSPSAEEIISPNLLASVTVRRTPACFSLGMDDWLSDSDENEEGESPLQPEFEDTRPHQQPTPVELAGDDLDELMDMSLTQKELEEFGLGVDDDNDFEGSGSDTAGNAPSEQSPSAAPDSIPACERGPRVSGMSNDSEIADFAPVGFISEASNTVSSLPGASGALGNGMILVSSREVGYSQVVSMLRHKHSLTVTLCPLGHSGYVVSNRMMVERKLQSDLSTPTTGRKIVSALEETSELYGRVSLIVEKDPVREGRRKPVAKPGHYWEHALAELIDLGVKVLFSQSQEDTASLLARLVEIEGKKGHAIRVPPGLQDRDRVQSVLQLLLKIPRLNYVTALNLCAAFETLHELINASPEEIKRRIPSLSLAKARNIYDFFEYQFDENLVG